MILLEVEKWKDPWKLLWTYGQHIFEWHLWCNNDTEKPTMTKNVTRIATKYNLFVDEKIEISRRPLGELPTQQDGKDYQTQRITSKIQSSIATEETLARQWKHCKLADWSDRHFTGGTKQKHATYALDFHTICKHTNTRAILKSNQTLFCEGRRIHDLKWKMKKNKKNNKEEKLRTKKATN